MRQSFQEILEQIGVVRWGGACLVEGPKPPAAVLQEEEGNRGQPRVDTEVQKAGQV